MKRGGDRGGDASSEPLLAREADLLDSGSAQS